MDKNIEISLLFDFYGELLSDKQHDAVALYYNDDLSLSEVSEVMGITRQGVRDLVKRSEAELYEYEEKLGLFKRFEKVGESALKIRSLAERLIAGENPEMLSRLIIQEVEKISEQEA